MMTHLDLCTGIGGFHLAATWAGFQTIGFCEIEPYCCKLLAEKWPDIPNYGDIRTANFSGLRGSVTVLSAGVPCQPASLAGKRRGASDDRWLWSAVLNVVRDVEPAWAIFENPPGILTLDEFGAILLRLESLGYALRAFGVPANAVGAKHRRQRVFIVAHAERGNYNRWWAGRRETTSQWSCDAIVGSSTEFEALADTNRQRFAKREEYDCESDQSEVEASQRNDIKRCTEALADAAERSLTEALADAAERSLRIRESRYHGNWRLTQPPLCRRTDGIPNRSHRLKALGNAVVPQQAYPFFAAIEALGIP